MRSVEMPRYHPPHMSLLQVCSHDPSMCGGSRSFHLSFYLHFLRLFLKMATWVDSTEQPTALHSRLTITNLQAFSRFRSVQSQSSTHRDLFVSIWIKCGWFTNRERKLEEC